MCVCIHYVKLCVYGWIDVYICICIYVCVCVCVCICIFCSSRLCHDGFKASDILYKIYVTSCHFLSDHFFEEPLKKRKENIYQHINI